MLHRRRLAALGAAATGVLAFTVFLPPSTPGPLERDFEAYYAAGAVRNAGGDPYSRAIWPAERGVPNVNGGRDELLPFVGPAAALPLWALLARLPYLAAGAVWTLILGAAVAAIVVAALRIAAAPHDPLLGALTAGVAVAAAPTIGALALGQAALASAGSVALAIAAYRARWFAGAVGATLVAALQPNLALPLAARLRSRWDAAAAAVAAGIFALLTLAAGGGPAGLARYVQRLGAHGRAERDVLIQHTPAAIAYAFGATPEAAAIAGAVIALLAVAAGIAIVVRERLDATAATLVACALLPLVVAFFHEQDFAIDVLPILVLGIRATGRARSLAAVAAVLVLVDWFGLAQRHGAAGQIVCLGLTVALGFAGLSRSLVRLRRRDAAGIAALALLALVMVPAALAHPAPTWPDDLPPAYHAPPAGDASSVWADEQRAAGLTARDPVWGLLRALPLAGCLVLCGALVADARTRRRVPSVRGDARDGPSAIGARTAQRSARIPALRDADPAS